MVLVDDALAREPSQDRETPKEENAVRQGEIRFEPQDGTTQGYGDEDVVKFYESSLGRRDTNEPLLAIASKARGMRLTVEQASELHEWLGVWLDAVQGEGTGGEPSRG
jgi:hypothetical protein